MEDLRYSEEGEGEREGEGGDEVRRFYRYLSFSTND
jgi:hypothetical protein